MTHWELCKKLKFDHITKWYMHKPESLLEKETCKILCDFEITKAYLIPARRFDLVIVNKKENLLYSGFCCPSGPWYENQRKQKERDKYFDLSRE